MMIKLENVSVTYPDGTNAVSGVNLHIRPGEHVALIGANGAGKSSLLMAMMGVLPPGGRIEIDGLALERSTVNEIRSCMGIV